MAIEPGDPDLPDDVDGSTAKPRRCFRINLLAGTSSDDCEDFVMDDVVRRFCDDEPQRTLMHDNLSSHLSGSLHDRLTAAGHRAICRPPWCPSDGPIEWAFDESGCALRKRGSLINNTEDLTNQIRLILTNVKGFDEVFAECGCKN